MIKARYMVLFLCLVACSNPPINKDGANCAYYGVSEQQSNPIIGEVDSEGMPVVEIVTTQQLKGLCGNKGFWDTWSYGCVDRFTGKAYAHKNIQTVNHEKCHRLLGPKHG